MLGASDAEWQVLAGEAQAVMAELVTVSGRPMVHDLRATLDAVGEQIGRTRERVRKIELQALTRLRQRLGELFRLTLDPV